MTHDFKIHDAHYIFESQTNAAIPNFNWFMGALSSGGWENDTFQTFKEWVKPGMHVVDVGGWIGPTAIWLAQHARWVHILEPDPVASHCMKQNLLTSGCRNWTHVEAALWTHSNGVNFGAKETGKLGDSESRVGGREGIIVNSIVVEELLQRIGEPIGFLKLDIEGAEEYVLANLLALAQQHRFPVWIAFHWPLYQRPDEFLESLRLYFSPAQMLLIEARRRSGYFELLWTPNA